MVLRQRVLVPETCVPVRKHPEGAGDRKQKLDVLHLIT